MTIRIRKEQRGEDAEAGASAGRQSPAIRVKVEARRARKKPDEKARRSVLDLDGLDDSSITPLRRVLYLLATIVCVLGALIGAVLPIVPAIPLWILAAVCLSHAFPAFGHWLAKTRIYRWLIAKRDEPKPESRRGRTSMPRRQKNRIMIAASICLVAVLIAAMFLPGALHVAMPHGYRRAARVIVSIVWVALWIYLYLYKREPEATIRTTRKQP